MAAQAPAGPGQGRAQPSTESQALSAPGIRLLLTGIVTVLIAIGVFILHAKTLYQ
jgi:hypothetical protein